MIEVSTGEDIHEPSAYWIGRYKQNMVDHNHCVDFGSPDKLLDEFKTLSVPFSVLWKESYSETESKGEVSEVIRLIIKKDTYQTGV